MNSKKVVYGFTGELKTETLGMDWLTQARKLMGGLVNSRKVIYGWTGELKKGNLWIDW